MLYCVCHGYFAWLDIKGIWAYGGGGRAGSRGCPPITSIRSKRLGVVELRRVFECTMRARCHEGPALSQDHEPAH